MKFYTATICFVTLFYVANSAEIRLLDLEPSDAQQHIDKQDTTLNYAPKVDSNVPAVRFLGNEPHNVLEDIYLAKQYHGQDGLGGYLYGYAVPDIAKTERKQPGGDLRGAYNYIAGDGQEIKVEYWDDGTGFHQIDNVPKIQPKQIDDTPEVRAAKEEHLRIWQEQAERNSKPIANPYNSEGQYAQGPLSAHGQQQTLQLVNQYQAQKQSSQNVQYQGQQNYQGLQSQSFNQYQKPDVYQGQQTQNTNQYQQVQYQQNKPQQQYQPQQQSQPQQQYQPQYQQNQPQQQQHQQSNGQYQQNEDQSGQYQENEDQSGKYLAEEGEQQGPPKGFFYSFDYPVGIIVQKDGGVQKRSGDLKDIYATNKASFEQQLQGNSPASSSSTGYLAIKN